MDTIDLGCGKRTKGSYVLALSLAEGRRLSVGKLGTFDFPAGCYLYFGSALNGLEARISRHLRRDKKLHWHIDFLTQAALILQVWWKADLRRLECSWAKAAIEQEAVTIPAAGFGSSDCRCKTHLVHLDTWSQVAALGATLAVNLQVFDMSHSPDRPDSQRSLNILS
ncbi:MAG: GIY-YIG nuclease family protein [Chloroflexi bacterium]|nr:GIY-YIG nuclease family protein [Chloroflexota bacterium]